MDKPKDLRDRCGRSTCNAPIAHESWTQSRVEGCGPGWVVTCDKCGNSMAVLEVLDEDFRKTINDAFEALKEDVED